MPRAAVFTMKPEPDLQEYDEILHRKAEKTRQPIATEPKRSNAEMATEFAARRAESPGR